MCPYLSLPASVLCCLSLMAYLSPSPVCLPDTRETQTHTHRQRDPYILRQAQVFGAQDDERAFVAYAAYELCLLSCAGNEQRT